MRIIVALLAAVSAAAMAADPPALKTPNDVVAGAPAKDWVAIPAGDLLQIELADGRKVVLQLATQFAPVHVANIKALARAGWWDGAKIYRVQDNYVVQWGNNESDKPLPAGVVAKPPAEYSRSLKGLTVVPLGFPDAYAPAVGFSGGWPMAYDLKDESANLTHCYGMVGVGRDLSPDTGTGGELYAVIGHAPRHLDRNIAVVGRVISGFEAMTALPRGTEALGFYKDRSSDVPIKSAKLVSDLSPDAQPRFEYLAGDSFAEYVHLRANRHDAFYIRPAGGVDVCNVGVPVRAVPAPAK
ncbi:peptidylprolyl isomerase [Sphingomonas jaspsi]|uniref:peptidylprolyl isomerase n=1 Tax=Sphingomonas jaspsi TaxID=392409 RepID=UPI0004B53030|nr:peptidylprolyl isomerase [Sphingomonas jaspsi]